MVDYLEDEKLHVLPPAVFKEFAAATPHEIHEAEVKNTGQGIVIVLRIGNERRILGQYRGGIRFFRSFDGAAAVLRQHGVLKWAADAEGWIPRTLQGKKSERSTET